MKLRVEFNVDMKDKGLVAAANMTIDDAPCAPELGDIVPIGDALFRVVQRAFFVEKSTIELSVGSNDRVVIVCTLVSLTEGDKHAE